MFSVWVSWDLKKINRFMTWESSDMDYDLLRESKRNI